MIVRERNIRKNIRKYKLTKINKNDTLYKKYVILKKCINKNTNVKVLGGLSNENN